MNCMAKISKSSKVVTFRLDNETFQKLKKNHPNVSEYLRARITYDITRKHVKGRWNDRS